MKLPRIPRHTLAVGLPFLLCGIVLGMSTLLPWPCVGLVSAAIAAGFIAGLAARDADRATD